MSVTNETNMKYAWSSLYTVCTLNVLYNIHIKYTTIVMYRTARELCLLVVHWIVVELCMWSTFTPPPGQHIKALAGFNRVRSVSSLGANRASVCSVNFSFIAIVIGKHCCDSLAIYLKHNENRHVDLTLFGVCKSIQTYTIQRHTTAEHRTKITVSQFHLSVVRSNNK